MLLSFEDNLFAEHSKDLKLFIYNLRHHCPPAIVVGVLYGQKVDDVCKPETVRDQGLQTHEVESFDDTINTTKCVRGSRNRTHLAAARDHLISVQSG